MVSSHLPRTYGTSPAWTALGVLTLTGALARHFMNVHFGFRARLPALLGMVALGAAALFVLTRRPPEGPGG